MVAPGGAIWSSVQLGQAGNLLCVTEAGNTAHVCHDQRIFMLQAPVCVLGRKHFQGWWWFPHDVGYLNQHGLERKGPKEGPVYREMPL